MMVDIDGRIIYFVRKRSGFFLVPGGVGITENTDLDVDLGFDASEIEEVMREYSEEFNVDMNGFDIKKYYLGTTRSGHARPVRRNMTAAPALPSFFP